MSSECSTIVPGRGARTPAPARRLPRLVAALLAVVAILLAWKTADQHSGVDAYQFWIVGRALHESPMPQIYDDAGRERLGATALERARRTGPQWLVELATLRAVPETYSTPLLYTVAAMASGPDYETYLHLQRGAMLLALAAGVLMFARLLGHDWTFSLYALALVAIGYQPFSADLQVGNVGSFQLAGLAAYAMLAAQPRHPTATLAAGALMGVAVAFKPNLAIVVAVIAAYRVLAGQYPRLGCEILGGAAGLLLAVLATGAAFGSPGAWIQWFAALRELPADIIDVQRGNFAPARVLSEALDIGTALPSVLALLALGVVVTASALRARVRDSADTPLNDATPRLVALGALGMLLGTSLAWHHYFVLAIPALLLVARTPAGSAPAERGFRWTLVAVCFAGLSVRPYLDPRHILPAQAAGTLVAISVWTLFLFSALSIARCERATSP